MGIIRLLLKSTEFLSSWLRRYHPHESYFSYEIIWKNNIKGLKSHWTPKLLLFVGISAEKRNYINQHLFINLLSFPIIHESTDVDGIHCFGENGPKGVTRSVCVLIELISRVKLINCYWNDIDLSIYVRNRFFLYEWKWIRTSRFLYALYIEK